MRVLELLNGKEKLERQPWQKNNELLLTAAGGGTFPTMTTFDPPQSVEAGLASRLSRSDQWSVCESFGGVKRSLSEGDLLSVQKLTSSSSLEALQPKRKQHVCQVKPTADVVCGSSAGSVTSWRRQQEEWRGVADRLSASGGDFMGH